MPVLWTEGVRGNVPEVSRERSLHLDVEEELGERRVVGEEDLHRLPSDDEPGEKDAARG